MSIKERERIIRELTEGLRAKLVEIARNPAFPEDWDGKHLRVIASNLAQDAADFDACKRARRDIRKSMSKYALSPTIR